MRGKMEGRRGEGAAGRLGKVEVEWKIDPYYPLTSQRPSFIDKDSLLLLIGYFVFTQPLRLA